MGSRRGGSGEIRTHGGRKASAVFKTAGLNHSPTLPKGGAARAAPSRGSILLSGLRGAVSGPAGTASFGFLPISYSLKRSGGQRRMFAHSLKDPGAQSETLDAA